MHTMEHYTAIKTNKQLHSTRGWILKKYLLIKSSHERLYSTLYYFYKAWKQEIVNNVAFYTYGLYYMHID